MTAAARKRRQCARCREDLGFTEGVISNLCDACDEYEDSDPKSIAWTLKNGESFLNYNDCVRIVRKVIAEIERRSHDTK